jgi:hypothetical protein
MGALLSNGDDAPPKGMTRAEAQERDELLSAEDAALHLMRDPDRRRELQNAEMRTHAYYVACQKRVAEYWAGMQKDDAQSPQMKTPEGAAIRHQHLSQLRLLQSNLLVATHMRDAISNGLQAGQGLENMARLNRVLRHLSENESMLAIKELTAAYALVQRDVALVMNQIGDIPRTSTRAWSAARPSDRSLERLQPTRADDELLEQMLRSAPSVLASVSPPPPPPHSPQPPPVPAAAKYRVKLETGHSS